MGTLHQDRCTFLIISRSFLLRMRNVSYKVVKEIKTLILCSITFFNHAILRDNVEKYCKAGQATDETWRTRIACWVRKATDLHIQNV